MTDLAIHPLTPDRWDDFVGLFESDSMCRRCWCMGNVLPSAISAQMTPDARRKLMHERVSGGPPPGLLAYAGDTPIGWLALGARGDTPDWNGPRKSSAPETPGDADDPSVWAATCVFVRSGHRGAGVTSALLDAGVDHARRQGAARLEACPMSHDEKRSVAGLCVGPKRVFERAGFETVLERKPGRPLMRLDLRKKNAAGASKPAGQTKPERSPKR